jgi:DNA-directed RNA polymerase subunit RPC12/RpoP
MSRKTTIGHAAVHGGECAAHIQNTYEAQKYDTVRSIVDRRGVRTNRVQFSNAQNMGGAILRGILGLNVAGMVSLSAIGNDLQVKVVGTGWAGFVRGLVFLCGGGLAAFGFWPLCITAIIGFFMQKAFLDKVYKETIAWLSTKGNPGGGESAGPHPRGVAEEVLEAAGELEYRCPHCAKRFFIPDDTEEYMFSCPHCGKELDLTEINPL